MLSTDRNCRDYVICVARDCDADGNLAIIRSVSGVEGAAAVVEADITAKMAAKCGFEGGRICSSLCCSAFWHGMRLMSGLLLQD